MMSIKEISELISVFLLCSVKFGIGGMPMAVFLYHLNFWTAFIVCNAGGITGVIVFTYFLAVIKKWFSHLMRRFKKETHHTKKKFTFTNKLVVRVKQRFGLLGIAVLTPSFLSIPLGIFLSLHFFKKHKVRILIYHSVSIIIWELILFFSLNYFKSFFQQFLS